jgi:hypothetical protein
MLQYQPNYQPHSKQLLLHNAPLGDNETLSVVLYGGTRGGGKSAGLLADAVFFALTYPGAKICIIRESLDAVKQSFLDKLPTLFPAKVGDQLVYEYKEKSSSMIAPLSRSVVFPNGSYITFQRVANYQEALTRQGWEFHYLIIDELTKQTEDTFNYLLSTVRSARIYNQYNKEFIQIPTKVACGTNPGGVGHRWVKERFIDRTVTQYSDDGHFTPIATEDYKEIISIPDRNNPKLKKEITMNVRFIPASWADNPFLNDSYVANLMQQSDYKREMDMYGNWQIVAGKMFRYEDDSFMDDFNARELISKYKPDIYISIDWGYKPSYHAAGWYAVFPDRSVIRFKELYGQELIFEDFVKKIKDMSTGYYIVGTCLPHDMYRSGDKYRDDSGRVIGEMKSDVFENAGLNPVGVTSGKGTVSMRYDKIHSASQIRMDNNVKRFRITNSCNALKQELDEAVFKDDGTGRIDSVCLDHALDEFGLFLTMYSEEISPIDVEDFEKPDLRDRTIAKIEDEFESLLKNDAYYDDEGDRVYNRIDDEVDLC